MRTLTRTAVCEPKVVYDFGFVHEAAKRRLCELEKLFNKPSGQAMVLRRDICLSPELAKVFAVAQAGGRDKAALSRALGPALQGMAPARRTAVARLPGFVPKGLLPGPAGMLAPDSMPPTPVSVSHALRMVFTDSRVKSTPKPRLPKLKLPEAKRIKMGLVEGVKSVEYNYERIHDYGQLDFILPYFVDRFIMAATFKQVVGRPAAVLMLQDGEKCRVVNDSETIDLEDRSKVFRIEDIEVYS